MEAMHPASLAGVDAATEVLTPNGWRAHDQLAQGDYVLAMDPVGKRIRWSVIAGVVRREWTASHHGPLVRWTHRSVPALSTPGHPWLEQDDPGRKRGDDRPHRWATTGDLRSRSWARLAFGGGTPGAFATSSPHSDEFVELLGWIITEGCFPRPKHGADTWNHVMVSQSERSNPEKTKQLRRLASHFRDRGYKFDEYPAKPDGVVPFYIGADLGAELRRALPGKQFPPSLICSLTLSQAELLYDALIAGDGNKHVGGGDYFIQVDQGRIDSFQMLASMLGSRTAQKTWEALKGVFRTTVYTRDGGTSGSTHPTLEDYTGVVWHPDFPARRHGWPGESVQPSGREPPMVRRQT